MGLLRWKGAFSLSRVAISEMEHKSEAPETLRGRLRHKFAFPFPSPLGTFNLDSCAKRTPVSSQSELGEVSLHCAQSEEVRLLPALPSPEGFFPFLYRKRMGRIRFRPLALSVLKW